MDAVQKALRLAKAEGGTSTGDTATTMGATASDPAAYVNSLYSDILGRPGEAAGVNQWVNAINSGAMSRDAVRQGILGSSENQVQDLYSSLLGRGLTNDPGAQNWIKALDGGALTTAQIRDGIMNSPEYQARQSNPGSGSNTGAAPGSNGNNPVDKNPNYIPMSQLQNAQYANGIQNTRPSGMPLVYTPPPYKDYGATAAAFRVASGLENLPAGYNTLSPVVGGTPASGADMIPGTNQPKTTYQQILQQLNPQNPVIPKNPTGTNDTGTPKNGMSAADIAALYSQYLGRSPERGAAEQWLDAINTGRMTYNDVVSSIKGSPEATVYGGYQTLLGRGLANDPGAQNWVNAIAAGQMTPAEFQANIKASPEYTQRQINSAYQNYLGRAPEEGAVQNWANSVSGGGMTLQQAINAISGSPEAVGNIAQASDPIAAAYQTYLGRAPEAAGASDWSNAIASGAMSTADVIAAIAASPEAQSYVGFASGGAVGYANGGDTPNYEDLVRAAYRDFLYRDPDEKGYSDWLTALNTGEISPQDFESRFKDAGYEDDVAGAYMKYLKRPPEDGAVNNWLGQINDKSMTLDQVLAGIRNSGEAITQPTYQNVPTADKFSELQGGRMYDIDIGRGERIPKLGMIEAPINVKEAWENSEIERLKKELEAAKNSGSKSESFNGRGGGGEGNGGDGTAGGLGDTAGGGGYGSAPGNSDSAAGSPAGDGGGPMGAARGGSIGNNAIDNALRMLSARR